jgi:hypothetical protein
VKPPVDAPMSSAVAPLTSSAKASSACASLQSAASHPRMIGLAQLEARVAGDRGARLADDGAVDAHVAGEDDRTRPLARRDQAALDQQHVESQFWRARLHRAMSARRPPSCAAASAAIARSVHSAARRRDPSMP